MSERVVVYNIGINAVTADARRGMTCKGRVLMEGSFVLVSKGSSGIVIPGGLARVMLIVMVAIGVRGFIDRAERSVIVDGSMFLVVIIICAI